MAEKRKLESNGQEQVEHPSDDGQSTSPQDVSIAVENYPRKRIAIAVGTSQAPGPKEMHADSRQCNVCRFRKTRCDAQKPVGTTAAGSHYPLTKHHSLADSVPIWALNVLTVSQQ